MTLERASELVKAMKDAYPYPDTKSVDLFRHLAGAMNFHCVEHVEMFAEMCGFETKFESP